MTTAARLATYASFCFVGGAVDIAALAGWAVPRAFALSTPAPPAPARETVPAPAPAAAASGNVEALAAVQSPPVGPGAEDNGAPAAEDPRAGTLSFATNSVRWSSGQEDLAALVRAARDRPQVIVEIDGHCDDRGTEQANHLLSLRRAQAVAAAFAAAGVPRERLRLRGHGSRQPRAVGRGDVSWSQNRRVEIQLEVRGK